MRLRPTEGARGLLSLGLSLLMVALAGCGGRHDDDDEEPPPAAPTYSGLVSFGDSLSDMGSYRVGTIAALGGGRFTVNGPGERLWIERLARRLGLPAPCAAQTGLESAIEELSGAPVTEHPDCRAYAQGGARVTDPVGPNNRALFAEGDPGGALGALTRPVVEQLARHLRTVGGRFSDRELVTVWTGPNDLLMQLRPLSEAVEDGADEARLRELSQAALAAMGTAGAELAAAIRSSLLERGATRVVVLTMPDLSLTPFAREEAPALLPLIRQLGERFNAALLAGLDPADPRLLRVDAQAITRDLAAQPARYGIANGRDPACRLEGLVLPSALLCTESTLRDSDVSAYFYADDLHPTPFGQQIIAAQVMEAMRSRGWL